MPTSTVEDYLKAILLAEHEDAGAALATGRLAAALGVTPGTATTMAKTLAESGLASYEPYGGVRLTRAGRQLATHVLRRHRLVELFLVEVLGLDWSAVHDEAERLEHAVSDRVIERMDEMLGRPAVDPHGDPIPDSHGALAAAPFESLATCPLARALRVARVADQSADFLRLVERVGLRPGARFKVRERDAAADTVELDFGRGRSARLGLRAAEKILVEPAAARA
ncbi:MAG: metal-dependent transcriptional regulator [Thermoanaerobaculia bacterium]